MKSSSVR
jgi:hypothetical protein